MMLNFKKKITKGVCVSLLGVSITRYNKLGSLNNRNLLFPHRSGGQKSELKILKDNIERYSGGRGEGESVPVLS